uniref:Uncharacterized protein n=1 Tax=Kwoniella pini CBS 10737 TaxID=1296096 RepID=A0A1B9I7E3_9TREE|nr:uncharacterized protein I206_02186 [Kwoniella pini CBS 10737]OCF51472.1 hypothetical protein I206_02186 [Kwoniella pini CBS 10737]
MSTITSNLEGTSLPSIPPQGLAPPSPSPDNQSSGPSSPTDSSFSNLTLSVNATKAIFRNHL